MKYTPFTMNIELTTKCPLKCSQCYCSLETGKNIDIAVAENKVKEAAEIGVKIVNLSGGETLCYPHLYELVKTIKYYGLIANISTSGVGLDERTLDRLVECKIDGISISLNGSTEEINSQTRDGYKYAIKALELLKEKNFKKTTINWVMHKTNAENFPQIIELAEKMNVHYILVLAFKPDASHEIKDFPSKEQIVQLSKVIETHKGKTKITIQTCFSQLVAIAAQTKLFGNLNNGPHKGCPAGRSTYTITIDGLYAPCRHLEYHEQYTNIEEYWNNSPILHKLRNAEESKREPCLSCSFSNHCLPCFAVNSKLNNEIYIGHEICDIWRERGFFNQ